MNFAQNAKSKIAVQKTKILLVDDLTLMRDGVRALLSQHDDLEIIGEAADGREAVKKALELNPDVVLIDMSMPQMNGIEATHSIVKNNPNIKILIIGQYDSCEYLISSINAGASGYVPKVSCEIDLVSAIRTISAGELFVHPSMLGGLVQNYLRQSRKNSHEHLSDRELEVLRLVAEGKTSRQIADNLVISPKTVFTVRSKIMKKLNLHNQIDLLRYAMSIGLVKTDV